MFFYIIFRFRFEFRLVVPFPVLWRGIHEFRKNLVVYDPRLVAELLVPLKIQSKCNEQFGRVSGIVNSSIPQFSRPGSPDQVARIVSGDPIGRPRRGSSYLTGSGSCQIDNSIPRTDQAMPNGNQKRQPEAAKSSKQNQIVGSPGIGRNIEERVAA